VQILAKGSSSMRNVEGDTLRGTKVDVEGFDFKLATVDDPGCRGADCDRARERDFGGAVAGRVTED
jgi:hypothetical protein